MINLWALLLSAGTKICEECESTVNRKTGKCQCGNVPAKIPPRKKDKTHER